MTAWRPRYENKIIMAKIHDAVSLYAISVLPTKRCDYTGRSQQYTVDHRAKIIKKFCAEWLIASILLETF